MSNLNEASGLPELPEGHWWEVCKHITSSYSSYFGIEEMEDGYEVCVVTKKTIPASTKPGKRWWNSTTHTPEHTKDSVVWRKHITDPVKYAAWMSERRMNSLVGKAAIDAADVLKAAKDIIDLMQAKAEREARELASEKLLGIYPPKKLGVTA